MKKVDNMSMETKNDFAKKRILFSVAFVAVSVIVLLIIFLVNKDKIFTNLKETNFFEKIFGSTPAIIENHQVKHDESQEMPLREEFIQENLQGDYVLPGLKSSFVEDDISANSSLDGEMDKNNISNSNGTFVSEFGVPGTFNDPLNNHSVVSNNEGEKGLYESLDSSISNVTLENNMIDNENIVSQTNTESNEKSLQNSLQYVENTGSAVAANNIIKKDVVPKSVVANSSLDLCFVMIDNDGAVLRKMIKRAVPRSDSPLTTAINLLLEGPDVRNKEEAQCRSLIPEGSKLLSARVSDGIAYLNFNEDFEFNPFGVEGSIHQLEQIVYTATAFSTVNSVQFLIEGEKREYMGSEGQWIGTPLSRANF